MYYGRSSAEPCEYIVGVVPERLGRWHRAEDVFDFGEQLFGWKFVHERSRQNGFPVAGGLPPRYRGLRGEPRRATR